MHESRRAATGRAKAAIGGCLLLLLSVVAQACGSSPTTPTPVQVEPSAIDLSGIYLSSDAGSFTRLYFVCGRAAPAPGVAGPIALQSFEVWLRDRAGAEYYAEGFPFAVGLGTGVSGCFGSIRDTDPNRAIAASFRIRVGYQQGQRTRTTEITGTDIRPISR